METLKVIKHMLKEINEFNYENYIDQEYYDSKDIFVKQNKMYDLYDVNNSKCSREESFFDNLENIINNITDLYNNIKCYDKPKCDIQDKIFYTLVEYMINNSDDITKPRDMRIFQDSTQIKVEYEGYAIVEIEYSKREKGWILTNFARHSLVGYCGVTYWPFYDDNRKKIETSYHDTNLSVIEEIKSIFLSN